MIDPNRKVLAFIDEYGDSGLDFTKGGTSSHFIVTAIILNQENIKEAERILCEIRDKYFQGSEIKSSKIKGKQVERRCKILKSMLAIDFSIFSVVVDKKALYGKGFGYHPSFYKFCTRLVFEELFTAYPNLEIVADEHGDNAFIKSFIKYVYHNSYIGNLFNPSSFSVDNSKPKSLIQLADFIGGTLAKGYKGMAPTSDCSKYNRILQDRITYIKLWPKEYPSYSYNTSRISDFDNVIADFAVRKATSYLNTHGDSEDMEDIARCSVLTRLLFQFQHVSPSEYITTKSLMNSIYKRECWNISEQKFRADIIGHLRDQSVIIASSGKGYKLPMNVEDLYDFIRKSSGIIEPMINRVINARDNILLATQNKVDILDGDSGPYLKILAKKGF